MQAPNEGVRMYSSRGRGRSRSYFERASSSTQPVNREPTNERHQKILSLQYSNSIDIKLGLQENVESWFNDFNQKWNLLKNSPSVVQMFTNFLLHCDNPYEEVLRLMYNSKDFKCAKPKSLAYFIMDEFKKWVQRNPQLDHLLTTSLKLSAFNIARQQSLFPFLKLISNIYKMHTERDMFFKLINEMIQSKQFKEACQIVMVFGLHSSFGIDEFLFPLVLQDKMIVVEEFLSESKKHQVKLVQHLDSLLGNNSVKANLDEYFGKNDIPEIKHAKLHSKPFRKLVTRLKKKYNLPDEVTPNLIKKQNEGALLFLIHRRYTENAIGEESFKEMIHEAVKNDLRLQQLLVSEVTYVCDYKLALSFANLYQVSQQHWPPNLVSFEKNPNKNQNSPSKDEEWDVIDTPTIQYYKLNLPLENINLIDSADCFEQFLSISLNGVCLIGIDCEWKPSFGSNKSDLALIQIATPTNVFILDVVQIGAQSTILWQKFGKHYFNNNEIMKLGFGLAGDFSMISDSLPGLKFCDRDFFVDLLNIWKEIKKDSKVKLPFQIESGPSLSTLVQSCFGFPLNKADQFSNWEKRPLRQSQIEYAALDAYCLIEIWKVFRVCCSKVNVHLEDIVDKLASGSSKKNNQKKGKHKFCKVKKPDLNITQPASPHENSVAAENVKIICDTMLFGLAKYLRKCGIDTKMLEKDEEHSRCVWYYENEKRLILTKGLVFNKLFNKVPPGWCLKITSDDVEEQFVETMNYYKIIITKENVFSRCQVCNSKNFVSLTKSTMNALLEPMKATQMGPPPPADYLEDEATGFSSDDDLAEFIDYSPHRNNDNRKWDLCPGDKINIVQRQTRMGAPIQIDLVPKDILNKYDQFFLCENCGKVYWDGSHFDKVISSKLHDVIL